VENKLPLRLETKIMCPLTAVQKYWYRALLTKDAAVFKKMAGQQKGRVAAPETNEWKKLQVSVCVLSVCLVCVCLVCA